MTMNRRAPIGRRGLILLGSISGGITFLVLWGDGAEIGRAVLAGLVVATWLVGFIAALNWYNQQRQRQVVGIIRQMSADPGSDEFRNDSGVADALPTPDGHERKHRRPDF